MTDRGLNRRLRQRSRRAGVMIGISMAITIALCVAGFSVIFNALDEFTADFVSEEVPPPQSTTVNQPPDDDGPANPTAPPEASQDEPAEPEATTEPPEGDNQIAAQETSQADEFVPDYQNSAGVTINLRAGPGTNSEVVIVLTPAQELQFLGERQVTTNPARDQLTPDQEWMKFVTEDGQEGWVREIDVEPYDPNG